MPDQIPTISEAENDSNISKKESATGSSEAKRCEGRNGTSSEQYDEDYEACKVKLKAMWQKFCEHGPKWIEAGCAILLVIITGSYTFVAWHQWYEMVQSNTLTKTMVKSAQSASVVAEAG